MLKSFLSLALVASVCSVAPAVSAAPKSFVAPLVVPLDKAWEALPSGRSARDWRQGDAAGLLLKTYHASEVNGDTLLESVLGDLSQNGIGTDDVKWYLNPSATVVRWTEKGRRHLACARELSGDNGGLTLLFLGNWTPELDKTLSSDVIRACRETSLPKK